MAWSIHTSGPTDPAELRAALEKVRDLRLRADERGRILEGVETDEASVRVLRDHIDRAIDAACALTQNAATFAQVSLSGDGPIEGIYERTTVSIDLQAPE